jgi:GNAT superfamily N-acetyltransferase
MTGAVIRRAQFEDYGEACRLFGLLDLLHRDRAPWLFKAPGPQSRSQRFFNELLTNPDSALFVADAGPIVGLAHGEMRSAPDLPTFIKQRWGVVDDLVVDPAWRRRGIGRGLAHTIEHWALELGASWIELNVYGFNEEAAAFYRSLGYLPLSSKLRKPRDGL